MLHGAAPVVHALKQDVGTRVHDGDPGGCKAGLVLVTLRSFPEVALVFHVCSIKKKRPKTLLGELESLGGNDD